MSAAQIGFSGGEQKDKAMEGKKAAEKLFSPEFRNRLDSTITFHSLTMPIMEKIVDKFITELTGQLASKRVRIELHPAARAWLARHGHDPIYGARPLSRLIQTKIKDLLSEELLFGKLTDGGLVTIGLNEENDDLTFDFS